MTDGLGFEYRRRFLEQRLTTNGDCWEWTGAQHFGNGGGPYGRAMMQSNGVREQWYAHRLSWVLHRSPIPEGLTIDHLCRNTLCVNPDHLEPVPPTINSKRGVAAYRAEHTHCPQGHDEWVYRSGKQGRYCAECNRIRVRENKRKRKHV